MRGPKSDAAWLQDMLTAAEAIVRYAGGKNRAEFDANEMLRHPLERRIEILGEAARGVSPAFSDAHPEIPWRKIRGTRHILAHEYGEVDPDIIWRIATQHVPQMLPDLKKLIPTTNPPAP